ncbi:MAG TPA: sulfatase [Bryobacteraceae bacterium]|nr:sulfatase [Bryobacteraceae bacterium]
MTTRRQFNQTLLGVASAAPSLLAAPAQRPNIIMIYADDLGYGDLGCYGHPTIRTPNLDCMAQEGLRFTQFYSAAPVCTPSRAALMTGRLPVRSGLTRVLFPYSDGGMPDSEITIAETLREADYRTACIGKWHLGWQPQFLPTRHGFDSYFGLPYSNDMTPTAGPGAPGSAKSPPLPLFRNEDVIEREPDQSRLTERYTAEALAFIRQQSRKPFFLYYPQTFPHVPLYAGARFKGKSARGLYGDVVEEIDWSVGEILRAVKTIGQNSNTLIVFSSDNGPWLIRKEFGGSAGLLREGKGTTWDGGMREPCIARFPGRIPAGKTTAAIGTTMDLFPTFAHYAGAAVPSDREMDGEDLSAVFEGRSPGKERTLYYWSDTELRAVRRGPWKLHIRTNNQVDQPPGARDAVPPELYNLDADPSEKYNVSSERPEIAKELLGLFTAHRSQTRFGTLQR